MIRDAEKYKNEDSQLRKKVEAKNGLENYAYSMRNSVEDEKLKDKIEADDKAKIESAVTDILKWVETHQESETEEFEAKQKELESLCNPILAKVYQSAGAEGGGHPGGMPDFGQAADAAPKSSGPGPKIEEVD